MSAPQPPGADEARASLEQIAAARNAAAEAARRPAWFDAVFAAVTGFGAGFATLGGAPRVAVGFAIIVIGGALMAVVEHRTRRRRGRILDERAMRTQPLRFFIPWLVVFGLIMIRPSADWQPWYAIAAGVLVALAGFVYLRWGERYQTRRLAAGDYDRYDLI